MGGRGREGRRGPGVGGSGGESGRRACAALACLALVAWGVAPGAAWAEAPASQRVTLEFDEAPLEQVVRFFAELTGERFIIAGALEAKRITILAPAPVSVGEAWGAFMAALSMNGLTTARQGSFIKIIDAAEAPGHAPLRVAPQLGARPEGVGAGGAEVHMVRLAHADAAAVEGVLRRLSGEEARIASDGRTNSVIVVGAPPEVERLMSVIKALDVPGGGAQIRVYRLQHAKAAEAARLLEQLTAQ